jgi:phosphoribosyl 1,2-cyclic phosphate phosphodiesterase
LIDTSPDFRYQALHFGIERLDAILYTHSHADHILGLDDVRPYNFLQKEEIPIYTSTETLETIQRIFHYVFDCRPSQSSRPRLQPHTFNDEPICAAGITIHPIRVEHGQGTAHGFRFGDCAYLTDHSGIPQESLEKLAGLDVLFLDALRHNPHPTHSTVEEAQAEASLLHPHIARSSACLHGGALAC